MSIKSLLFSDAYYQKFDLGALVEKVLLNTNNIYVLVEKCYKNTFLITHSHIRP